MTDETEQPDISTARGAASSHSATSSHSVASSPTDATPQALDEATYKKNIDAFKARFPELFALQEQILLPSGKAPPLPNNITLQKARNGSWTALYAGTLLHSSYNPEREAEKLVCSADSKQFSAGVFMGAGLGYAPVFFSQKFPQKTLIIIEPDINRLISAFYVTDWTNVFRQPSCVILTGATQPQIIAILEKAGIDDCLFFETPAHELHDIQFFSALKRLVERNRQKHRINSRTLKAFSRLWFSNMCRNIDQMALRTGITAFEGKAAGLSACIIAAGPSLDGILPKLAELKKRCIIICVDTALRACLRQGVQPHFVVLTDPQYWNARHIEGLSAPETILVTETAAYPSVFRFECRSIHLCSSFFPLGQYIEKRTHINGKLGTGGSVASTTWDLARFMGCKTIYIAGLDLGFPDGKTHTKGSTFEEKALTEANRLKNAETSISGTLFSAGTKTMQSYNGKPIRTDSRMTMYAWWFESRCAEYKSVHTCTLTPESLSIPGISAANISDVLSEPEQTEKISNFIETCEAESLAANIQERRSELESALNSLRDDLQGMRQSAEKALFLCRTHCQTDADYRRILASLSECDKSLMKSEASELASLLFPGKEELDELEKKEPTIKDKSLNQYAENLLKSSHIYARILDSISLWEKNLLK